MSSTMFKVKIKLNVKDNIRGQIKLNVKDNIRGQNQAKCQEQYSWSKSS